MCVCRGEEEGEGGGGGEETLGLRTIETIRLVTSGGGGATSKSSCACVRPLLIVQCNPTRAHAPWSARCDSRRRCGPGLAPAGGR